jgi:hypothetical protein
MNFQYSKGGLAGQTVMDGAIVQDQHQWTFSGMLFNQMLQEGDESFVWTWHSPLTKIGQDLSNYRTFFL